MCFCKETCSTGVSDVQSDIVNIDAKINIIHNIKFDEDMENSSIRTTLTLPAELVQAADSAVSKGKAKSRNDFVARAIRNELAALLRAEIDAEFAEMANDTEYQAEVEILNQEFAHADWEAFKLGESQS